MFDPHIHPDNVGIVNSDYKPLAGLRRDEFPDQYFGQRTPDGALDWKWPDADGAIPGTVVRRPITSADSMVLDRIGGGEGMLLLPA